MKRHTNQSVLWFAAMVLLFAACEKDEERLVANLINPAAPVLTFSATSLALDPLQSSDTTLVIATTAADFGFNGEVEYTILFDNADGDFSSPRKVALDNQVLAYNYTTADLNQLAILLGVAPSTTGSLKAKVMAQLKAVSAPVADTVYSNEVSFSIKPYLVVIDYPKLYVPGSYQGWSPGTAKTIVSVKADNTYEGFVYFASPNTEFKFTNAPNWNNGIYGDVASAGNSGTIASPGNNFKAADAGYYRLNADLNANTWASLKTAWGIIGNATPTGWGSDTDMIYDEVSDTWSISMTLTDGFVKFRANDGWDVNLGDNGGDALLEYGGADIPVTAGTYTITLKLIPGNYTYTIQ